MNKYCSKGIYEPFIHRVSWLLLILFPFVLSWSDSASSRPLIGWHVWVQYLFFLVIFYLNYCLFIDRLLFRHKTTWFVVCNVLLLSLLCFVLQYIHDTFRPQTLPFIVEGVSMPPYHPPRMGKILNDLLFMVMFVGLSMALKIFLRTRQVEIRNRELEQQRKDAELKNLKHQLNPHFIFNTLNNIYALIAINGEKAQQVVLELSNLLRYVLYENKETFVPVEREIDFIKDYIALMSIRQGKDTHIDVSVNVELCRDRLIAPLIFIPLVENAFKHGVSPIGESFIRVKIVSPDAQSISCTVENSCYPKGESDCSGSGIGLENMKRQLSLLYPHRHKLNIIKTEAMYSVSLDINLENCTNS